MKDFIDQHKWILGIIAALFAGASTVGIAYVDWQIDTKVRSAVKGNSAVVAAGEISPDRIAAIEAAVAEAKARHLADAERMDSKIERVVTILLEE